MKDTAFVGAGSFDRTAVSNATTALAFDARHRFTVSLTYDIPT